MTKKILPTLLTILLAASCAKEADIYSAQDTAIQEYVEALLESNDSYTVTMNDGVARVTLTAGAGAQLGKSGAASVYYAAYKLASGLTSNGLLATNIAALATEAGLDISAIGTDPVTLKLSDKKLLDGLRKGLAGAQAGEECLILFNAKEGYGAAPYGTIPANAPLAFRIWITQLTNE